MAFLDYTGLSYFLVKLHNIFASKKSVEDINDETTGINLFRGTRDFVHGNALIPSTPLYYDGWYWTNTVGKSFDKDDEGFTVLTVTSTTGTNQISNSTLAKLEAGEIYTFSFEYMQHDNHTYTGTQLGRVRVLGKSSDMPLLAYANIATYVNNVMPEQWMTVKVPIVIPELNQDAFLNVYFEMLTNINSSYSIRKACLYKGSINHPIWSASPFDYPTTEDVKKLIPEVSSGVEVATPSEVLNYIKGSTSAATIPSNGVLVGDLPEFDQEEDPDISTLPSEGRPLGGIDTSTTETEGDDKAWLM